MRRERQRRGVALLRLYRQQEQWRGWRREAAERRSAAAPVPAAGAVAAAGGDPINTSMPQCLC
jgi:urease accessory protein UreF